MFAAIGRFTYAFRYTIIAVLFVSIAATGVWGFLGLGAKTKMNGLYDEASDSVAAAQVTPAADGVERIGNLAVLDLGVKQATIDNLAARGFDVHVLPQSVTIDEIRAIDPVAVFYSNGPGDPATADATVAEVRKILDADRAMAALTELLPGPSVPVSITVLAELPRTPSGKADRKEVE